MAGRRKEKREKTQKTKSRKQNIGNINGEKKLSKKRELENNAVWSRAVDPDPHSFSLLDLDPSGKNWKIKGKNE